MWFTLKISARPKPSTGRPPFALLKTLDTGPVTQPRQRRAQWQTGVRLCHGRRLNEVQVYRTDDFSKVATIPVGRLPHGIWPSGDGTRVYVGLENEDRITAIDTLTNKVIATSPIGQAPQAVVYVPQAVPAEQTGNNAMTVMEGNAPTGVGTEGLQPLGVAGQTAQLWVASPGQGTTAGGRKSLTSVTLFDQGLVQAWKLAVSGLEPGKPLCACIGE